MLELKVATRDITHGTVAVAWCVDAEIIKKLADQKVNDPQVVIVVAPTTNYHIRREYRKVVPLKDLMTYLEFRSSGENRIWAFIYRAGKKQARDAYLTKAGGEFAHWVLNGDGNDWSANFGSYYTKADGSQDYMYHPDMPAIPITVNVPAVAFAAEPAVWEKEWVNLFFHSKAADQCDFRRRRLFAYGVQPIIMLLDMVARLSFFMIAFMWLSRGLTFKYFHFLRYGIDDTLELFKGGSWLIPTLPEDKHTELDITFSYVVRKLWKLPFLPPCLLAMWLIFHFHHVMLALTVAAIVIAAFSFILLLTSTFVGLAALNFVEKFVNWRCKDKGEETPWYLDEEEMESIICNPSFDKRTSVSALPAKHRTLRLYYQDLKSRVCRPFSL